MHWVRVNSSENVQNEFQYDHLGNLIWHKDPDYGISTSLYNAYGQLKRQENPRGFVSVFDYDVLGRLVTKETKNSNDQIVETTVWNYSEEEGFKGTLSSINYNYGQQTISYTYDEYLRVNSIYEHIYDDNCDYVTSYTYDPASRIASTTYPTGITTTCRYNNYGYLTTIEEGNLGVVWRTDEITEKGLLKKFTLGNGLVTEYDYYPKTDLLKTIQTKKGNSFIQNLFYDYDDFHNLAARTDNKRDLTESFTYDAMNRLTGISLNGVSVGSSTYDVFGRMTNKTKDEQLVFTTDQNSFDPTNKPHALRSVYANQGVFSEETQIIEYTPFDKVRYITEGENTLTYKYGFDHQRIKMTETVNGISRQKLYLDNCEVAITDNNREELTFISGPIGVFAVVETDGNNSAIHYIHKDHLGSWTTITNDNGQVEQEVSFDAWGNLRDPNTWLRNWYNPALEEPMFDRGYTGHEHMTAFGLINMNGRCYDPVMSSFLSVDAFVQSPDNSQSFNRYAYCMNNPLKFVDPSGWKMEGANHSSHTTGLSWGDLSYVEHAYTWRELCGPGVREAVAMALITSFRIGNNCSIDGFVSLSSTGGISDIDVFIKPKDSYYGRFNGLQLNYPVSHGTKGKCVVTSLGSTNQYWFTSTKRYGDGTKTWIDKSKAYEKKTGKEFNKDIVDFILWNDEEGTYSSYQASLILVSQIKEALDNNYVVGVCVYLNNQDDIQKNSGEIGHFANVSSYISYENGSVQIGFLEPNGTSIMKTYEAPNTNYIWMPKEFSTMGFIKYKLNP